MPSVNIIAYNRLKLGMNQRQLAIILDWGIRSLQWYEAGNKLPYNRASEFAILCKCDVADVVGSPSIEITQEDFSKYFTPTQLGKGPKKKTRVEIPLIFQILNKPWNPTSLKDIHAKLAARKAAKT